jgi:hypothetical protein
VTSQKGPGPTCEPAPRRAAVKGACARPPEEVDGRPSGASIDDESERLPPDTHATAEAARSGRVLSETQGTLQPL